MANKKAKRVFRRRMVPDGNGGFESSNGASYQHQKEVRPIDPRGPRRDDFRRKNYKKN